MNLGAYMTPHVAYMQNLGLETLDARYRVQADNALRVAQALKDVEQIKRVNYIGLEDNPIFGNFTPRQRQKMDVLDPTIRLSIGLEAAEDIIEDIVRSVEG